RQPRPRLPRPADRGQDPAPDPAGAARPAHPLGPPLDAAPARRLALGPLVHHGAGAAALHPVPDLTTHHDPGGSRSAPRRPAPPCPIPVGPRPTAPGDPPIKHP